MRYKQGEAIENLRLASESSNDMLLLTAYMAFFIGIALFYMGRRAKIMWLYVWGTGLSLISLYMGTSRYFGFQLFEHF